jgi:anthranilate 1,2-dioxygenase small subunit
MTKPMMARDIALRGSDAEAKLLQIENLLTVYCHRLDDGDADNWPKFFTVDGSYEITTRENVAAKNPIGIMLCEKRGMMADRILAMNTANVFESHVYCHVIGRPEILGIDGEIFDVRTNFIVHRTMYDGRADLFATGKYCDLISFAGGAPLFKRRRVVLDSRRIDTLLVMPL